MRPLREKKIIDEIRSGKWVDRRKWPHDKVTITLHNVFLQGIVPHQRMAILKAVRFTPKNGRYYPAKIDTKYSFPNAFEIAILEEAGMIFEENNA